MECFDFRIIGTSVNVVCPYKLIDLICHLIDLFEKLVGNPDEIMISTLRILHCDNWKSCFFRFCFYSKFQKHTLQIYSRLL